MAHDHARKELLRLRDDARNRCERAKIDAGSHEELARNVRSSASQYEQLAAAYDDAIAKLDAPDAVPMMHSAGGAIAEIGFAENVPADATAPAPTPAPNTKRAR